MWSVDDVFAKMFAIANSCVFCACVIIPSCSSQECISTSTVIHGGRRGKNERQPNSNKQQKAWLAGMQECGFPNAYYDGVGLRTKSLVEHKEQSRVDDE